MNLLKSIAQLSFFLLLTCYACGGGGTQSEKQEKLQNDQLQGSWEVTEAERDGTPTETLQGLFFRFTNGKQLTTNLLGSDMENGYELEDNKIMQQGTPEVEYAIESLEDKKMTLKTKIQGFDFKLVLKKVEE